MPRRISANSRRWLVATLADNRTPIVLEQGTPLEIVRTALDEEPHNAAERLQHYDRVVNGCLDRKFPPETVCVILRSLVSHGYSHHLDINSPTMNRWYSHPGVRRKVENIKDPHSGFTIVYRAFQKRLTSDPNL